ncbi:MAG: hypothetical protein ACI9H6_000189 [Patiriisocius sp.]|jgi:hypothetical protein
MRFALQAIFFLCISTYISIGTPFVAHAQLGTSFSQASASTITSSPRHPEPGEIVTLGLNDFSINTNGSTIRWFVNGVLVTENDRSIKINAGALGVVTEILVTTTLPNGATLEATHTIQPIRVDMLIEADTLTPAFYKGRSIPSSGSLVRVTAVPFTGIDRDPETYSYTWKVKDKVQDGGSRYGNNSVTFTSEFERNMEVSVDIIDTNGKIITSETIYVPLSDPELYYYEINPLRGMSEFAITKGFTFVGDEIRVRAEPYFISSSLLNENPHREWKLNGSTISNPSTDPQEITLRKQGENGSFRLEFHIRNLKQLLQGVKEAVTISF